MGVEIYCLERECSILVSAKVYYHVHFLGDVIGSNSMFSLYVLLPQLAFLKLDLVVALLSEIFAIKH